jgi:hypothetical protein
LRGRPKTESEVDRQAPAAEGAASPEGARKNLDTPTKARAGCMQFLVAGVCRNDGKRLDLSFADGLAGAMGAPASAVGQLPLLFWFWS